MFALEFPELRNLLGMAGETRVGDIITEGDLQWGMRVFVAVHTPFQFKVRFPRVTLIAFGDVVLRCGAVTGVAVETGNRLVSGAGSGNIRRRGGMAFTAVIQRQSRFYRCFCPRPGRESQDKRNCQNHGQYVYKNSFSHLHSFTHV